MTLGDFIFNKSGRTAIKLHYGTRQTHETTIHELRNDVGWLKWNVDRYTKDFQTFMIRGVKRRTNKIIYNVYIS